ncbi:MAG: hypothetical protein JW749_05980 [Sedimentisphaerales bacterium]|nr:hypothetical protein [Sedimentisphaerales bacterium]
MIEGRRQTINDRRPKMGRGHIFSVLRLLFSVLCLPMLFGCDASDDLTEGVKIGELAPANRRGSDLSVQFLRSTNIDIITYELPVDKIADLDGVWQILSAGTLKYTDPNGFAANGLQAAMGVFGEKAKITEILDSINAKKLSTTSLLIQHSRVEVLELGRLSHKTEISYIGRTGAVENVEVGPAILGLEVYARQLTGSPKVSRVQVTPAVLSATQGLPAELAAKMRESDLRIYSAGFGLNMKPGDIIVLAPNLGKIADSTTAAGRFFVKMGTKPTVRVLLFICTSIT